MPYPATVYQVMIASPSDVVEERVLIREVIDAWNAVHSTHTNVVLLPVGWETHAAPGMGRPQELINRHVLEDADLLVALFWNRLGSHTGKAASGTVEEIEKHIRADKPAMIYFSTAKISPQDIDQKQFKALSKFKKEYQKKAYFGTYSDLNELRKEFTQQIALTVLRYFKSSPNALISQSDESSQLSEPAKRLLVEAAKGQNGTVIHIQIVGGLLIEANGQSFVKPNDPRDEALWEEVIDELLTGKLLKNNGGDDNVLNVTNKGYKLAESLEKKTRS